MKMSFAVRLKQHPYSYVAVIASLSVAAAQFPMNKACATETQSDSALSARAGDELQSITVTAQYTSAETARKAQEMAPNIIDIETYTEIKQLPDISTAEAVRRVPGVSLETDEGEGRYVNIRGLDADLNSTTFGGLRLPPTNNASPFGGYRAVTLDSIPIGLVGAITVTKSNLPSQDAEALGGTIEITPKTAPLSGAPFLEGDIGSGYEPLRHTPLYNMSLSGGGRFGGTGPRLGGPSAYSDQPFSVVATVTYYEDRRGIDDVEPAYFNDSSHPYSAISNIQQRDYELNRRRHGFGIDLGYQPNADNKWYVRAFEAGYTERYRREYLNLTPDGNTTVDPAGGLVVDTLAAPGALQMALRDERETALDRVFMAGGENTLGENTLDYRLGYTVGTYDKPYDYNSTFDYTSAPANATITYGSTGTGHTPLYTIGGADYLNASHYLLSGFGNSSQYNFDKELSFNANLDVPLHWGNVDSQSVKVGLNARLRKKGESAYPTSYATLPNLLLSNISDGTGESYYNHQYNNPPDIPPGYLQSLLGAGTPAGTDVGSALQQYLVAKEDVYAAYVQYQMKLGPFGVIGGVRVENTQDSDDAYQVQTDSSGAPLVDANGNAISSPIHTTHQYTDVFPGIQTRYEIHPNLIARATWSSTLARPGFNQINPSQSIDLGSGLVTVGNPDLKPAKSNSFDVTIEQYLTDAGIISAGLFDKEISDYIIADTTGRQIVLFHGQNYPLSRYSFANTPNSYARGVELNWQQHLTFLPGLLSGLGLGANYTYVDSRFTIRPGEHSPLPSTSKNTWNATLFYEARGVTVRLAAYSVSADLFAIGGDRTSDVYNDKRTSMDLGSSYQFAQRWQAYFNAKNLLNTPHDFYQGSPDRPIQREFYGLTYQIGLRFNL